MGTKRRTIIVNADEIERMTLEEATQKFLKNCVVRNLSKDSIHWYEDVCRHFAKETTVKYVDEITRIVFEEFVYQQIQKGKRVTTINTYLRALRVFVNFCSERDYCQGFKFNLLKEDEVYKEPYTDEELMLLLARPKSKRWVEWRTWASVNYLLATGNRLSTMLGIKISDIDFENNLIHLGKLKNRKQQIVPLSLELKKVIKDYLKTWDYSIDDYLFPSNAGGQLKRRAYQDTLKKYNHARGVEKASAHLFRHTYAKCFILAGGGMTQLQMLLGHSTMDMTRHYINLYGMDLQKDYDRVNPLDTLKKRTSIKKKETT